MEGPALAAVQLIGTAETPEPGDLWITDDIRTPEAAETMPGDSCADGTAKDIHNETQATEQRDNSDPFARILQKVVAPAEQLKEPDSVGRGPTLQELKAAQVKRSPVAGAHQQSNPGPLGTPRETDVGRSTSTDAGNPSVGLKHEDKEGRETSEDTAAPSIEFELGRSGSSRFPEGVRAIGSGTLVEQDELSFSDGDICELATACQSTSDMAASSVATIQGRRGDPPSSGTDLLVSTSPRVAPVAPSPATPRGNSKEEAPSETCEGSDNSQALQWPFESSLRPWEDVRREMRKTAEGISGHQLEDYKKKRIWVVHRDACTPVSWYVDTSAEDVKTSVLCACDVLADEGDHQEEQGIAEVGFCLRQIRPLPDSADVDCDDLFMKVKTLTLRCGLPSNDDGEVRPLQSEASKVPQDAGTGDGEKKEDGAISVRVVLGPRVFSKDFPSLTDGATYLLERAVAEDNDSQQKEDLANLRKLTGDKWRRLSVAVDPLLHIEAQKAILQMRRGSNLLKHTRFGHPHLRQFQLSADRQRLLWYSANKGKDASVVQLSDVQGLVLGQKSVTFASYRIPALQHLSFSLILRGDEESAAYPGGVELPDCAVDDARTLDLTCKDEFEFDFWVTGFKAIIAANKGLRLSKMHLLSHSRRFLRAVKRSDATVQLTKLPEVKERAGLQDCMDLPWHPPEELERKYELQKKRVNAVAEEMRGLDRKAVVRSNVDISVLLGAGPAYANILGDSAQVDDEEMEFERMRELLQEVLAVLNKAKAELTEYRESVARRVKAQEVALASMECAVSTPSSTAEPAACPSIVPLAPEETPGPFATSESLETSDVLAISSEGQILMRTGAPGLTFEEKFKMASANSMDLEAVHEQVKEGLSTLLQHAASQTAEAQQLFSSALAAAAAAVGVETESQGPPADTLPPEDIEKLKSINQLLWRAEVDVENIEDMLERLQAPSGFGGLALSGTVASLNQVVTEQVSKWGEQLASVVTGFLRGAEIPQLVQTMVPQRRPPVTSTDSEDDDDFN